MMIKRIENDKYKDFENYEKMIRMKIIILIIIKIRIRKITIKYNIILVIISMKIGIMRKRIRRRVRRMNRINMDNIMNRLGGKKI